MSYHGYTWEEGVVRGDRSAGYNTMRSYTASAVYSTQPTVLCFIPETWSDDEQFLRNLIYEGHWAYVGKYDHQGGKDVHFITTDPCIRLGGWNVMIRPVEQWLGWIVDPGLCLREPLPSNMYTFG